MKNKKLKQIEMTQEDFHIIQQAAKKEYLSVNKFIVKAAVKEATQTLKKESE